MNTFTAFKPIASAMLALAVTGCAQLSNQDRVVRDAAPAALGGPEQAKFAQYKSPLKARVTDRRFTTVEAMYLANEMEIGGFPFLSAAATRGIALDQDFGYMAVVESYWYSRYNMEALNTESRCGVHLVHGPYVTEKAIAQGRANVNRDRGEFARSNKGVLLQDILPHYMARTGFPRRFEDASPLMLSYESCDPHLVRLMDTGRDFQSTENLLRDRDFRQLYGDAYPASITGAGSKGNADWAYRVNYRENFLSLRWDDSQMSHVVDMGAEGQVLTKLALWAEFFMDSNHHDGQLLGVTPEDGYRGAVLTLSAVSKMLMMKSAMLYDGTVFRGADLRTAQAGAYYFPHRIGVKLRMAGDLPPRAEEFVIVDASSQLFDQASLLWGLSEFYHFADPSTKRNWRKVFGNNTPYDGSVMEQKYIVLAEGLAGIVLDTIESKHLTPAGTLVSQWTPEQGRAAGLNTSDLGMTLVALSNLVDKVHADPALNARARRLLRSQADLLAGAPVGDGSVGAQLGDGAGRPDGAVPTLQDQAMAIRGLLAAATTLAEPRYKAAALRVFAFMDGRLWDEKTGLYRSHLGATLSVYTPKNLGAALGALREVILETRSVALLERYKRFWVQAIDSSGIQQSELEETGATVLGAADGDADGIPRPEFGDGKFGVAPVFASRVEIATP